MKNFIDNHTAFFFHTPIIVLLLMMYYVVFKDMGAIWIRDPNYSHGFLIPIVSAYFLWRRKEKIVQCDYSPYNGGLLLLIVGLFAYFLGNIGVAHTTLRVSFIFIISGIVMLLFGVDLFLIVLFPIMYLLFMIPLPAYLYDSIAFPLKNIITNVSVIFLKWLNFPVYQEGNIIFFPHVSLEIADACSGIRSLYSMLALSVAFAVTIEVSARKKILLVVSVIPIAIMANSVRVIGTAILARYYKVEFVMGVMHDFAGIGVFMLMVFCLISLGAWMKS